MVVADRGLQEVVAANLCRVSVHIQYYLSSAEALLVWIAGQVSFAAEVPLKISRELGDGCISFRYFSMDCNTDS